MLLKDVGRGLAIRYSDVTMQDSFVHTIRKMQDITLWPSKKQ
jgi:hypothetical protein